MRAFDSDVILYLNADILIFPDMIQAARDVAAQHEKFMVVGQRYDVDVTELVDFSDGWEARLREKMQREGVYSISRRGVIILCCCRIM